MKRMHAVAAVSIGNTFNLIFTAVSEENKAYSLNVCAKNCLATESCLEKKIL